MRHSAGDAVRLCVERHVEVGVVAQSAALRFDHLMEVGRVGERAQPARDRRRVLFVIRKIDVQGRAQLHASDSNTCSLQPLQRRRRVLVLDREVAAVEAEPDVLLQVSSRLVWTDTKRRGEHRGSDGEQPLLEERDRLIGILEDAIGLGLDVEVDERAVFAPDAHQRLGHAHDAVASSPPRPQRRHPAIHALYESGAVETPPSTPLGQERLQNSDQVERVVDPGIVTPVGRVDVGLDRRAVERSVGEAVDDGDVQPFAIEERAKLAQPIALEQLARLARRQPQPDAKRRDWREARLERRRVPAQVRVAPPPSRRRRGCSCSR